MAALPPEEPSGGSDTRWLAAIPPLSPVPDLGPQQLAWLGDAVWELHQRLRRCRRPCRSDTLHRAVVREVKAEAQASALRRLDPWLTETERLMARRGRNRAGRGPRHTDPALYGLATGFETMLGWLFLLNPQRLADLLDHLEESDASPPPPSP